MENDSIDEVSISAIDFSERLVEKLMPMIATVIQQDCKELFDENGGEDAFKQGLSNFICVVNYTFSILATAGLMSVMSGINQWLGGALNDMYKDTTTQHDYIEMVKSHMKHAIDKFNHKEDDNVSH